MEDVLKILDILRAHAETDLAVLNKRRSELMNEISKLKFAASSTGADEPNLSDETIWEKWRRAQKLRIKSLEERLASLEIEVDASKSRYKVALAKHLSTCQAIDHVTKQQELQDDENDAEALMEIFRLT